MLHRKKTQINYNLGMKLFVGLGNPGEIYKDNRHNVGFMFVSYLAQHLKEDAIPFKTDKYMFAEVAKSNDFIFAKPQTFMNESGKSVAKLVHTFHISTSDILVAHDDLDIPFGTFHIQNGRGPLLHNGLESVERSLGTKDFTRIRIGVDNRIPEKRINGEAYVLQNFSPEEISKLDKVFQEIATQLHMLKVYP